jgi:hypothetical protein
MNAATESTNQVSVLRERALLKALAAAFRVIEELDLDESIRIADALAEDLAPLPGEPIRLGGFVLDCVSHTWLTPALAPTLGSFREVLVDYFARMHHEPRLARERAESVVELLRRHLEVES